jgi:hypothetical protein
MWRIKHAIQRTPAWPAIRALYAAAWAGTHRLGYGRIPPPHAYKQREVKRYARQAKIRTLVETGTYEGHMIDATRRSFDRIYSIELDDALHETAVRQFAGDDRVILLKGDSGAVVPDLLDKVNEPALFWLDAHWSGGTTASSEERSPILKELVPILTAKQHGHIILIDDAREFVGVDGYPTLAELTGIVSGHRPDLEMAVDADLIRISPRSRG